jgi:hypothetical protein
MQLTSIRPPAFEYVAQHGDLLTQLGATKVEATDAFTIVATYVNNDAAVNAKALLKDTVWGAQLVVDNRSMTADAPTPNVHSMEQLLKGVAGLDVSTTTERRPDGNSVITARTADQGLATLVADLVKPNPTDRIQVKVEYANDLEQ